MLLKSEPSNKLMILILLFLSFTISIVACEKQNQADSENVKGDDTLTFKLTSPEIAQDSLLPVDYTCDGVSATLPLEWSGYPGNTKCFVLIMHHEASPIDIHWYWLVYNIPITVNSVEKNETGVGTLGTNSVNDHLEYAPPCSQGPGIKMYTYTIYALSDNVTISVEPSLVDRETLLEAIKDITIASAHMNVYYSRPTR
jgi:phosphatidylethanolamine-binding protein (PEBP) family uncharacterized protein